MTLALKLRSHQSVSSLFKGVGSVLLVKGVLIGTESVISEVTGFPKYVYFFDDLISDDYNFIRELTEARLSTETVGKHLCLKALAIAFITPFFCASLVETVQSTIVVESPGVFDCLREGLFRLSYLSSFRGTRLFPVWCLWSSTVVYGVSHYVIAGVSRYTLQWITNNVRKILNDSPSQTEEQPLKTFNEEDLIFDLVGMLTADAILYPLETIQNR